MKTKRRPTSPNIILLLLCAFVSVALTERRHVIELYNKNHQITKNILPTVQNYSQNSVYNNVLQKNDDNQASLNKDSKTKPIDLRINNLKTGVDYVQDSDTFTLSRRKPKSLKFNANRNKISLTNKSPKVNNNLNKFHDFTTQFSSQKQSSNEPRIVSVPIGTSQYVNSQKPSKIALESSPNNIIIEAPLYNIHSQEHSRPIQYGEYATVPAIEHNYAQVNFIPEERKNKISQALAASVAVPPLASQVDALPHDVHLSQNNIMNNIPSAYHQQVPLTPQHIAYPEPVPVEHPPQQFVITSQIQQPPPPQPQTLPLPPPTSYVQYETEPRGHPTIQQHAEMQHRFIPNHAEMMRQTTDPTPITEAEIQAEILEHFFNDDFFKGFFDTGPPIPPPIPPAPLPEPVIKQQPLPHQTPLGYEAPYIFPSKQSAFNGNDDFRKPYFPAHIYQPKMIYGQNPMFPQSAVAYQTPGVRYLDELKTAYSNNVEKKVNANTTDPSSVDAKNKAFPITIKKKVLGQENLKGKPWGEKTVISYSDPKDPNNFVQVSEMRMTLNRPLDAESASNHITKLMDHFGTGQHQAAVSSQHKFDDRK